MLRLDHGAVLPGDVLYVVMIGGNDALSAHPEAVILPFDLFSAMETLRASEAAAGVNVSDACFDSEAYRSSWAAPRDFSPGCVPVGGGEPRFDAYFFWAAIHPTAQVHAALGRALLEAYRQRFPDNG